MKTNRRRFLATVGATASVTLLSPSVFDFSMLAGPTFVRRDVAGLSGSDPIIVDYQKAITAMQGLVSTDVRSWFYQAAIHATTAMPVKTAWNTCQHGTHLFWAWHRMYLYWFERIVRKYSGDPNWALPYWNWTANPQLPSMFQVVSSSLYTPLRDPNINNGSGSLTPSDVDYSSPFAELDYLTAQGSIEGTPHGAVHVKVGGFPNGSPGLMTTVPTAAQDPIFYLHHANMDRLWDLYLDQGGGRSDPTSDSTWAGKVFTFYDENGSKVTMTPCDVLNASAQLGYTYEGEPPQVTESCGGLPPWIFIYTVLLKFPFPPNPIDGDPYFVQVDISTKVAKLRGILGNPDKQVYLELDGVATDRSPGVVWEVYVGLPAGVHADPSSPFFVGELGLFGGGVRADVHAHHTFKPANLRFNATKALGAVLANGGSAAPLTFIARGILIDGQPVTPRVQSTVTVTGGKFVVGTKSAR